MKGQRCVMDDLLCQSYLIRGGDPARSSDEGALAIYDWFCFNDFQPLWKLYRSLRSRDGGAGRLDSHWRTGCFVGC